MQSTRTRAKLARVGRAVSYAVDALNGNREKGEIGGVMLRFAEVRRGARRRPGARKGGARVLREPKRAAVLMNKNKNNN